MNKQNELRVEQQKASNFSTENRNIIYCFLQMIYTIKTSKLGNPLVSLGDDQ